MALVLTNKILDMLEFSWKAFVFLIKGIEGKPAAFLLFLYVGYSSWFLEQQDHLETRRRRQYNLQTETLTGLCKPVPPPAYSAFLVNHYNCLVWRGKHWLGFLLLLSVHLDKDKKPPPVCKEAPKNQKQKVYVCVCIAFISANF